MKIEIRELLCDFIEIVQVEQFTLRTSAVPEGDLTIRLQGVEQVEQMEQVEQVQEKSQQEPLTSDEKKKLLSSNNFHEMLLANLRVKSQ